MKKPDCFIECVKWGKDDGFRREDFGPFIYMNGYVLDQTNETIKCGGTTIAIFKIYLKK